MVIITGDGVREWLWYSHDPKEMMNRVNQMLMGKELFPIKFVHEDDTAWSAYEQWLNA